jgi:hypothetical protein
LKTILQEIKFLLWIIVVLATFALYYLSSNNKIVWGITSLLLFAIVGARIQSQRRTDLQPADKVVLHVKCILLTEKYMVAKIPKFEGEYAYPKTLRYNGKLWIFEKTNPEDPSKAVYLIDEETQPNEQV